MKLSDEFLFDMGIDIKQRSVILTGDINEQAFKLVDFALGKFESMGKGDIVIKINSDGGNIYDAMAIIGRIRRSKCNVITEGYGCVMSAALGILASGDKRRCSKYTVAMSHEGSYIAKGVHKDVKAEVKQKEKEEISWAEMMAEFSKKPKEYWLEQNQLGDTYYTPQQLLEIGVLDEIL